MVQMMTLILDSQMVDQLDQPNLTQTLHIISHLMSRNQVKVQVNPQVNHQVNQMYLILKVQMVNQKEKKLQSQTKPAQKKTMMQIPRNQILLLMMILEVIKQTTMICLLQIHYHPMMMKILKVKEMVKVKKNILNRQIDGGNLFLSDQLLRLLKKTLPMIGMVLRIYQMHQKRDLNKLQRLDLLMKLEQLEHISILRFISNLKMILLTNISLMKKIIW